MIIYVWSVQENKKKRVQILRAEALGYLLVGMRLVEAYGSPFETPG